MFNTTIPLYGIFIILSLILGLIVVCYNVKRLNFCNEEIIGILLYIFLGAIFGGKIFTFLVNYDRVDGFFDFYKTGLSSYGAVIGIILMLLLFSFQFRKRFSDLIYTLVPALPLMYGIGKIGCFLVGCCHGIMYDGPFSVVYNYSYNSIKGINLFPIQLLEAIVFILIFMFILCLVKKKKKYIVVIGITFILCGISKFLLDFLRISHINKIISINQIVSIVFIVIGLLIILKNRKIIFR